MLLMAPVLAVQPARSKARLCQPENTILQKLVGNGQPVKIQDAARSIIKIWWKPKNAVPGSACEQQDGDFP